MLIGAYRNGNVHINDNNKGTEYDCAEYYYNSLSPFHVKELDTESTLMLRTAVLSHIVSNTGNLPIIIKTHNANITVAGIELIPEYLSSAAVYIVRDPRDVAVSFARHTGNTIDLAIAHMCEKDNILKKHDTSITSWLSSWSGHVESWDVSGIVRLRYEDIKKDPETNFRTMLEAYGLKVKKKKLKKAIKQCDINRLKKQEEKTAFAEKGLQSKFFGQGKGWQNELTENQVKKIEIDHGEVMEKMGYKLEYM
jgi:hypothetical protein